MLAFHGKQEIKDRYLARVQAHYDADEIIKGIYWKNGKGCAVGCTLHNGNHSNYEKELGIPIIIAHLEDSIFEGLPNDKAKEFPLRFLKAIPVGADLSKVFPKFMYWLLVDKKHGVIKCVPDKCVPDKGIIQKVADFYNREISGEAVNSDEWLKAKEAVEAAYAIAAAANYIVPAADYTGYAPYAAAIAAAADYTGYTNTYADTAYAHAAAAGAASHVINGDGPVAFKKARVAQSEKLLELLAEAV